MTLFPSPRNRSTRPSLAAALAASALVLAACGGGESTDSSSSATPLAAGDEGLRMTALASAAGVSCNSRVNNTFDKLLECVTLEGVRGHQAALQAIADANNGIRISGSPGYDASVEYAAKAFGDAGYVVTVQPFQFQTFITLSPPVLEQVSPPPAGPVANSIFSYSGSGDVTAPVTALPAPPADLTPGCEAATLRVFPLATSPSSAAAAARSRSRSPMRTTLALPASSSTTTRPV